MLDEDRKGVDVALRRTKSFARDDVIGDIKATFYRELQKMFSALDLCEVFQELLAKNGPQEVQLLKISLQISEKFLDPLRSYHPLTLHASDAPKRLDVSSFPRVGNQNRASECRLRIGL